MQSSPLVKESSISTQHSVHLTGGYVPRFQAFSVAQAGSVKMAFSHPSRQQVTHAVSPLNTIIMQRHRFFICQIIVILGVMVLAACGGCQGNNSVLSAYTPANSPISTSDHPSSQPARTPLATRTPKPGHETPMSTP